MSCPIQWEQHLQGKKHARSSERYEKQRGITRENALARWWETIDEVGLTEEEKLIDAFRAKGVSIPSIVKNVIHVQKLKTALAEANYREISESSIIVEDNSIVGIVVFNYFQGQQGDDLGNIMYNLCRCSGIVSRSPKKKGALMWMWGARICNGQFNRYAQTKKPRGGGRIPGFKRPSPQELDLIAGFLAGIVYDMLKNDFRSWTVKMEQLVPCDLTTLLGRLGSSPFTTMGGTLNYHAGNHLDDKDMGLGVIAWFEQQFKPSSCRRTVFQLSDFGVFLKPRQGTIIMFQPCKIAHLTKRNIGYPQVGVVFAMKKIVKDGSNKRLEDIGFGNGQGQDDWESWI